MSALKPGSPEWTRLMTASKVAAALGVSPWQSPRALWHEMRGDVQRPEQTEVQSRGHYLEPAILAWWADQHPEYGDGEWHTPSEPVYKLGEWAAATPDMALCPLAPRVEGKAGRKILPPTALVEAKSAAFDDDWGDPGTDVIPAYYLTQVYWQMHVSGATRTYVPIITSRLRFAEYVVDYDAEIGADLEVRMKAFWDSLASDTPPPLDDSVATFDAIRKLHPEIDRGESVELTAEHAADLVTFKHFADETERSLRFAKSTVIEAMGRAQYATHNGVRIARRQPQGERVAFVVIAKPADLAPEGDNAA